MAIGFPDNIELNGKMPNFTRDLFDTIADMKAFSELSLPDVFIASCKEDGKVYVFNRKNEIDPDLGKWRPIGGNGSGSLKKELNVFYKVGGIAEGDTLAAGTEIEDIIRKMLEGEATEELVSYYGVAPNKTTDITILNRIDSAPSFTITVNANNEYIVIACPNTVNKVSIFSNGFDYTSSFTTVVTSMYTFYHSETKITCKNFNYTIAYE